MMRAAIISAALLVAPAAAFACEPYFEGSDRDRRIQVGADCSFENAAERDASAYFTGRAAVDLGDGRVAQRLTEGYTCFAEERLMMVDCATSEVVTFDGRDDLETEYAAGAGARLISLIQPPHGPVALAPGVDIPQAIGMAQSGGIAFSQTLLNDIASMRTRNRFDPFCGCALFYPDLPGAS
jgi:hypothetical protein